MILAWIQIQVSTGPFVIHFIGSCLHLLQDNARLSLQQKLRLLCSCGHWSPLLFDLDCPVLPGTTVGKFRNSGVVFHIFSKAFFVEWADSFGKLHWLTWLQSYYALSVTTKTHHHPDNIFCSICIRCLSIHRRISH